VLDGNKLWVKITTPYWHEHTMVKMANLQSHAQKESLSFYSTTGLTAIQFTALVKSTHQLPDLGYPKHQIPALILAQATL